MNEANEQEVLDVIGKALNLEDNSVSLDSSIDDFEEWDSLGHLGILSALDKFFNGKIASIKEMAGADSVSKILQSLKEHSLIHNLMDKKNES